MINNPTPEAKLKETPCTKILKHQSHPSFAPHQKADLKLWQNTYKGRKIPSTEQHEIITTQEMKGRCSLRTRPSVR